MARYLPFQRVFHSVELTLLTLLAAIGDVFADGLDVTRFLVGALLVTAVLTLVGHFLAIVTSGRLR
jgi:hypothetical protein